MKKRREILDAHGKGNVDKETATRAVRYTLAKATKLQNLGGTNGLG